VLKRFLKLYPHSKEWVLCGKQEFQMKSEKMKVVLSGWLTLALVAGFSVSALSEPAGQHDTAKKEGAASPARPAVVNVPLPAEYEALKLALEKVDSRGLTVKESVDLADAKKDATVAIGDVVKIRAWLEDNFKKYREFLTKCSVGRDRSSDLTGKLLDGFIAKLQAAITDDPKNASGLKEKHLITYVTQIERVLKEKANLFSSSKSEFEAADAKLIDQMKKTVGFFFGGYHGDQFDQVKQLADTWAKPVVEEAEEAVKALSAHEAAGGKVCKLSEDKAEEKKEEEKKEEAKTEEEKKGDDSKTAKKPDLGNPGPLEGTPGSDTEETAKGGGEEIPLDPGADSVDPGAVADIPGDVPFFDPAGQEVVNDFDADALLRGVLDRFNQLEDQAKLDQDRAQQDLQNAVDAARRLGDDVLRQQQAALDAQNNEDNGLADALSRLATPPPPPTPPAPPAPPVIPPVVPPSDSGSQQPFFPPQQDLGGGDQAPPQQAMPFFPPPQQSSAPIIIGGEEDKSYLEDEYYRRRNAVVPQVNPQAGGLLELVRLQQQLMYAQQQAAYGPQNPNLRVNVNTMANRLGGAAVGGGVRRAIPGRTTSTAGATTTQSSGVAGRSKSGGPAALRGSLAK
jgi:hypothetical protein